MRAGLLPGSWRRSTCEKRHWSSNGEGNLGNFELGVCKHRVQNYHISTPAMALTTPAMALTRHRSHLVISSLPSRSTSAVALLNDYSCFHKAKLERSSLQKEFFRAFHYGRALVPVRQDVKRLTWRASSYSRTSPSQPETVPVWLWLVNWLLSAGKSSFQFLCEQPMQLRHIEWPTVSTVVRMTVLTFIVVTCLIVLLATVDSTMSYVLASLLRRVP
ncbi:hypothetical protein R1sor_022946 [Riccia sorocarpa]|uniref:Preprotein translocase subunit SecE n=1 Tax=Riccia sorocarpa TaxID=122646 RepID=A0ABD3GPN1_9MARC